MTEAGIVHRTDKAGVATLTLDRGRHNALERTFADDLVRALRACDADPDVRAVVLTGAGRSFCVGADLAEGPSAIHDLIVRDGGYTNPDYREPAGRITLAMNAMRVPIVAAINGDAVGGGATITLAADLRFAAESARFGFPFTRLGVCPEGGSTYLLPRLVGPSRAADWLLSGRTFDAAEALAAGLVSRVLPVDQVLAAAADYATALAARCSPRAVAVTRQLLRTATADLISASDKESRAITVLAAQPDCAEGVAAFLDRRQPDFAAYRDPVDDPRDR